MTRDVLSSDPSYPINGAGPYEYLNPYREGALLVRIERDGILVTLDISAYTVDPVSSDVSGGIILSDAAAALYDGGDLFISRRTAVEQGWSGMSAREVGLTAQLDWMVETIQDNAREVSRSLRSTTAIDPGVFEPYRAMIIDENRRLVPGPSVDEVQNANDYAKLAKAWAEGTLPGGADTFSAREYSELLQSALLIPISHDDVGVTMAIGSFALVSETTSPYDAITIEVK
tara:strand:- start:31669 stop:32358 length:690 start_codon:yes stop_codon:yes gene_type:complete